MKVKTSWLGNKILLEAWDDDCRFSVALTPEQAEELLSQIDEKLHPKGEPDDIPENVVRIDGEGS